VQQQTKPVISARTYLIQAKHIECMYISNILPHLEYGAALFQSASKEYLSKLDRIHNREALFVSGCLHGTKYSKVLINLGWMALAERRDEKTININVRQ
jgi:hypothetical protein